MDAAEMVQMVKDWPEGVNLQPLFNSLYGHISSRKQRLAAVAMCRRIVHLFPDGACRDALDVAERYADREAKRAEMASVCQAIQAIQRRISGVMFTNREDGPRYAVSALVRLMNPTKRHFADHVADGCAAAAGCMEPRNYLQLHQAECFKQKRLLLDILPPIPPPAELNQWVRHAGGLARRLALGIYTERAHEQLPILADALEDAGCTEDAILSHLRGPGPHVRGCWPVDLILGKV
jgi:hypothetical protein